LDGYGGSDYYDLSNVDGNSTGMTIKPISGQFTMVNNPSLGKYNCGTVCGLEIMFTSIIDIFFYCRLHVHLMQINVHLNYKWTGQKVCASICTAIHNTQQREKYTHLRDIYNNPDTRSLVCCSCDEDHCVRSTQFNDKNH
jgi:hypothetical protein